MQPDVVPGSSLPGAIQHKTLSPVVFVHVKPAQQFAPIGVHIAVTAPQDGAIRALGADTEVTSGNAIADANATFWITSLRDKPANLTFGSSPSSS